MTTPTNLAEAVRAWAKWYQAKVISSIMESSDEDEALCAALAAHDAAQKGGERVTLHVVRTVMGHLEGWDPSDPSYQRKDSELCAVTFTIPPRPEIPTVEGEVG